MSTARSRRRSRLSNASNPSPAVNSSKADLEALTQSHAPEAQVTDGKDAGGNDDVESAVQEAQGSRTRRRLRLRRTTNHSPAQNDSEVQAETIAQETLETPEQTTTSNDDIEMGADNTFDSLLNEAFSWRNPGDLILPSLPENIVEENTDVQCIPNQDDADWQLREGKTENKALEKEEEHLTDTEDKAEASLNSDCTDESLVTNEELEKYSLSDELRTVHKELSATADKTYVQYFDTIKRKEEENEALSRLLIEEKHRRIFDKCMQQLVNSRGERQQEFAAMKKRYEDEIRRKDEDLQSISNLLLKEKQQRLLAKCHVELNDRRRRVEVRKLSEIVAQEAFKRKELECRLKSLLPEIKNLKSLVDLNGGTSEIGRNAEMNSQKRRHQEQSGQLDRTAQLLVHTKAHLFDVVNVYQQTNEKVNDLEAAIFKAREIARDLFDRGSKILDRKMVTGVNTPANNESDKLETPATVLLQFAKNATWTAGLLTSQLPSTPWRGPNRHQKLGNKKGEHALYDPLGLYTSKKDHGKDSDKRRSKNHKEVPVSARSSGLQLKKERPQVFRDDFVLLSGSKLIK